MSTSQANEPARTPQAAQRAIAEAKQKVKALPHYRLAAKQTSLLLRQHGLGQTIVQLQKRGGGRDTSPYDLLARQLDQYLSEVLTTKPGVLTALTENDSRLYLRATRHAASFLSDLAAMMEKLS